MRFSFPTLLLSLGLAAGLASAAEPVALFDGKTFDGWEGDTTGTWRIEDGCFTAGSVDRKQPQNDFLTTKNSYGDFELKFKCKILGDPKSGFVNGGVQVRSERIPNHFEMIGYQVDVGNPKQWGSLYDESRRKVVLAEPELAKVLAVVKQDDWNEFTVRCDGPRVQVWVNGLQTVDYTEPDKALVQSGKIAVQIHGNGNTAIWYKDITVQELK